MQKNKRWHRYSSESTQLELSNEYQRDRVDMVFKSLCVPVIWRKVASAPEGLITRYMTVIVVNCFAQILLEKYVPNDTFIERIHYKGLFILLQKMNQWIQFYLQGNDGVYH